MARNGYEIRADVLTHGVSDQGVLRQHYETDALDASTLLAGGASSFSHMTTNACGKLSLPSRENGFVLRYRTDETDDGLSGKEERF